MLLAHPQCTTLLTYDEVLHIGPSIEPLSVPSHDVVNIDHFAEALGQDFLHEMVVA